MADDNGSKCLLCGEIMAPVWVARMPLGMPGIAFMMVGKQQICNLSLFKELCQKMYQAGIEVLKTEGFVMKEERVKPNLELIKGGKD